MHTTQQILQGISDSLSFHTHKYRRFDEIYMLSFRKKIMIINHLGGYCFRIEENLIKYSKTTKEKKTTNQMKF